MALTALRECVQQDIQAVDRLIIDHLRTQIGLIDELSQHIINSGGKRLRPLIVLLGAKACNYSGTQHLKLAAAVEFFHTATLLHDDVIDESQLRRGNNTANAIWGDKASILVGDYLFTQAFQLMVSSGNLQVLSLLANTANVITRGEVQQLSNCHNPETSETDYLQTIKSKTAILFAASAQIGAILSEQPKEIINAMELYGLHLGNAFQLADDALDYCGDSAMIGKSIGDDLAEGKPTLPLIYALKNGNQQQQALINQAIKQGTLDKLDQILAAIHETKAIEYTYQVAQEQVDQAQTALSLLPDSPFKNALSNLANFSVQRRH